MGEPMLDRVRRAQREGLQAVEQSPLADRLAERLRPAARLASSPPQGPVLRGRWLGHALHPMLTDLPIGCWTSATILDLIGGRRSAPAAQRLLGLGLIFTPPTMLSGLADWDHARDDPATRRAGAVHAAANLVASLLYLRSWQARRRGHRGRGIVLGLVAMGVASGAGYLGGHLAFSLGSGTSRAQG